MPLLKVIQYPNPILSRKAEPIQKLGKEDFRLIQDMVETMYEEDGVGIAAPQVNIPKRIIIVSPRAKPGEEQVYLNPELIESSKEVELSVEGCLSLPGVSCEIWRSKRVKLKALNAKGEEVVSEFHDFPARVIQHEIDHLNGMLIIDRVDFNQRQTLLSDYRRL
jgi:peptide deformylase